MNSILYIYGHTKNKVACLFASEIGFYDVVLEGPPTVFLLDLHVKVLGPTIESMRLKEICWSILNFRTF
jgi:hypothetical protein